VEWIGITIRFVVANMHLVGQKNREKNGVLSTQYSSWSVACIALKTGIKRIELTGIEVSALTLPREDPGKPMHRESPWNGALTKKKRKNKETNDTRGATSRSTICTYATLTNTRVPG